MVVALGPGRFYGSSLPRPRYFPDPKLNGTRVDPPESVMDPLLSWANDAHWSMGGLSFRRLRLQGRIEGSVSKLRKMCSPKRRKTAVRFTRRRLAVLDEEDEDEDETEEEVYESDPEGEAEEEVDEEDDEEEEEEESDEEVVVSSKKRKRVRRLGDEFDRIAEEAKKREKESKKVGKRGKAVEKASEKAVEKASEKAIEKPRRVSPRKK